MMKFVMQKKKCEKPRIRGFRLFMFQVQKIPNALIDHIPGQIELEKVSLPTMDGKYKLAYKSFG